MEIDDVRDVLDTLVPKEAEVQVKSGAWYLMRIRPYRTTENLIEGAVITQVDKRCVRADVHAGAHARARAHVARCEGKTKVTAGDLVRHPRRRRVTPL